jgi:uracil-DNA glycosylase
MSNSIFSNIITKSWIDIFDTIDKDIYSIVENDYLVIKDKPNIFPSYKNIFNFTNYSTFEDLRVVILGQDPYHGLYYDVNNKAYYPQATGLAFSVPKNCSNLPPSLTNIYNNLMKFDHIAWKPTHGCLEYWAYQGVLLLNTSLTVEKSKPNSHQAIWSMFTDELISSISEKHPELIFVLWGSNALSKMNHIKNKDKHHFIISSHPSPLSVHSKIKNYDPFYETDHFGKINKILMNKNKDNCIDWQIY